MARYFVNMCLLKIVVSGVLKGLYTQKQKWNFHSTFPTWGSKVNSSHTGKEGRGGKHTPQHTLLLHISLILIIPSLVGGVGRSIDTGGRAARVRTHVFPPPLCWMGLRYYGHHKGTNTQQSCTSSV